MNKKILLILLLFPISIKAACTNQELTRYKTLASHVNSYYEYNEQNNTFDVTAYNLSKELKIVNKDTNESYNTNDTLGEIRIGNQKTGYNLKLAIYPTNSECQDYRVRTMYINLPYYNNYYKEEICKNNNHQLCSKWANTSTYTKEQFIEKVKQETKTEIPETPEPEPEINKYGFFDFLGDFYIPILLFIIIAGSIAIYKLDKKQKFNF